LSSLRNLRYHRVMGSFVEKTLAEQGFGASWRQQVAPLMAQYESRQRRRIMFASLAIGIAVGLGVVVLMVQTHILSSRLLDSPLHQLLVLALAVLAGIGAWVALLPAKMDFAGAVRRAVGLHFASLLTPDDNTAFGEVILQDLLTDGMLGDCVYRLAAHYSGTYSDSRIRMIEAVASPPRRHGHNMLDVLIIRVSLPFPQTGEVWADSRADRLASLRKSRPGLTAYPVGHDLFDGIFAVATTDIDEATRIFTDGFVETLLRIQERLISPLRQWRGAQPCLAMQAANGSLVLMIEMPAAGETAPRMTPAKAEAHARDLILKFAVVPALVDELQGGLDTPPAFAPLPSTDAARAVVAI